MRHVLSKPAHAHAACPAHVLAASLTLVIHVPYTCCSPAMALHILFTDSTSIGYSIPDLQRNARLRGQTYGDDDM